jgi:ribosomal protein L18E
MVDDRVAKSPFENWTYDQKVKFLREASQTISKEQYVDILHALEEVQPKETRVDRSKLKEELKKLL